MKKVLITLTAVAALGLSANATSAQSTKNVAPNNIAPPPNFGGPVNPPPSNQCLAVTLAGSVFVRICNGGYSANGAGTSCGGQVYGGGGNYTLYAGNCGNGQQFLGGNLACFGTQCNWTPSPAGFAAGFRAETVYAQYQ